MTIDLEPYLVGQSEWATSLANLGELMLPCLDAAGVRSVAEIGAYAGELTRLLADWAAKSDARVVAVDPSPQQPLEALARERDELELIRRTSLEALPELAPADAVIIDGDHNYWTVSEELRLLDAREGELPLLMFHDVCWPHGRRDDYYAVDQIPDGYRRPVAGEGRGIIPGDPGVVADGLPYPRSAEREGGARNGVRTAVEDFVAGRDGLRFAVVPAFFGFGVAWRRDAPWAERVAAILDPWDGNSLVARLEAQRVHQLAHGHARQAALWRLEQRRARQEAVLRRLLESSAFGLAERLSRLRVRLGIARDANVISKTEIRRALDEGD